MSTRVSTLSLFNADKAVLLSAITTRGTCSTQQKYMHIRALLHNLVRHALCAVLGRFRILRTALLNYAYAAAEYDQCNHGCAWPQLLQMPMQFRLSSAMIELQQLTWHSQWLQPACLKPPLVVSAVVPSAQQQQSLTLNQCNNVTIVNENKHTRATFGCPASRQKAPSKVPSR